MAYKRKDDTEDILYTSEGRFTPFATIQHLCCLVLDLIQRDFILVRTERVYLQNDKTNRLDRDCLIFEHRSGSVRYLALDGCPRADQRDWAIYSQRLPNESECRVKEFEHDSIAQVEKYLVDRKYMASFESNRPQLAQGVQQVFTHKDHEALIKQEEHDGKTIFVVYTNRQSQEETND